MRETVSKKELQERLVRFTAAMNEYNPGWDTAFILGRVSQYYFTGTMQDGLLAVKSDGSIAYYVRRSFERAAEESPLESVYPMNSYRDAAAGLGASCGNTYFETELVTAGILERLRRHFTFGEVCSLDRALQSVRAVKSAYELAWMKRSGKAHRTLLEDAVPLILREGISEADFVAGLFEKMVKLGYQGISRFAMFQTEMVVGQIAFGTGSLRPTAFDGPGGAEGLCPAVPLLGSRERKLKYGDLVFVDLAFGMNGYHTDKTQVYRFGGRPDAGTLKAHKGCMEVQARTAAMLRPGAVPEEIYKAVTASTDADFNLNFMGFGSRRAQFLGHGIGLQVDEVPVIAKGFREPLRENMVFAVEPKKGMADVGMVGVEDTYIVTPEGGRCITGGGRKIILL